MRLTLPDRPSAPDRGLFNPAERKRMRLLLFSLLIVVASLVVMLQRENERRRTEAERTRAESVREPQPETVLVTPQVDVAKLESLARDRTPQERALVEPAALVQAFADTRLVNDRLFAPMQGRTLDEQAASEIVQAPAGSRGRLFRAYGWVDARSRYDAAGDLAAHTRGRLRLEDGGWAYFAVLDEPANGIAEDDFVRVDGIFVEVFRGEGAAPGDWIEAPLLAGPRAVSSFPRLDPITELDPASFAEVTDDSLAQGLSGQPFYPYWELVSYAQNLPQGAVDWSLAPVLDRETMTALATDGARFRARPVRIPLSQIMESRLLAQKDNPLRLERLTEGWIGNEKWFGPTNGVIRYVSPVLFEDVHRKDEVVANGFFLKHLAYEPRDGGVAIAPFFVLHSMQVHTPVVDKTWQRILLGFTVGVILLGALIYVMLLRDRRRSAQLQEELLARRRARRRPQVGL